MRITKKIMLSLSIAFTMLIALVIGIGNMPKTTNSSAPTTVLGGWDRYS